MKKMKITKSSGNIFKDIRVSYPKLKLIMSNIKPIISKLLDLIALSIRIIIYIVMIFCAICFLLFIYTSLSTFYPLVLAVLRICGIIIVPIVLIYWAFLREKRDSFECPNKDENMKNLYNCGQPYACDACPYNKDLK